MGTDRFAGQVVWITGASSGIGRALALAFDRLGAKLILSGRDPGALESVREACGRPGAVHLLPVDLSMRETMPAQADAALGRWGHVDVMVHNAGIALRGRVAETPLRLDQQVMATNYLGPLALTKALLPSMLARGAGHFVVISSLSGKYGVPQLSAYAASKHALHGGFESLRAEVHDRGVYVTMVIPGFVRTPILQRALTGTGAAYGKTLPAYERGMDPGACAAAIVRAVARRKEEVFVGGWEGASLYARRFLPGLFARLIRSHPVRLRNRLLRLLTFGLAGRDS